MSKNFQINLFDKKSIRDAIKQLERYNDTLEAKAFKIVHELAGIGIICANQVMSGKVGDADKVEFTYLISPDGTVNGFKMVGKVISAPDGDVSSAILWEFGAGIHYNKSIKSTNPYASVVESETGISTDIGSYGKHQGLNDSWVKPDGLISQGTMAMMPMYKASIEVITNIERVAREVFNVY